MRERSAGERPEHIDILGPSEDPEALDPIFSGPLSGAPPWYSVPPGGRAIEGGAGPDGPRFLEGVPAGQFQITPFDHVLWRGGTAAGETYNPGIWNGNTGTRANGPSEIGDLTEGQKTGLTGLFLAVAALGVLWAYSK